MTGNKSTDLVPAPGPTSVEMRQDLAALVELKSAIMRNGTDYGTIPGCGDKPALLKPGAEKVLKRFMVHVVEIPINDLSTPDCIRYRVRCIGQTPDGVTRGVGIGECSTGEDKYAWRKSVGDAEFEDTADDRRRIKHKWGKGGSTYTVMQVRTNPADLANTVLKMAKKRAMVDLALTATAASGFFTQDLDDMDPELRHAVAAERAGRPADPFAPPVEITALVVPSPKRQVWERAKELGLDGTAVAAVLVQLQAPPDGDSWTPAQVSQYCDGLQKLADKQGDAYDGEKPPEGS